MRIGGIVLLLAALTGTVRAAEPVLLEPGDPRGKEVRAAASAFWDAVSRGDVPKAKSKFVGKLDHAQFIDSFAECVVSFDALAAALNAHAMDLRLGKAVDFGAARAEAHRQGEGMMILAGERAWIAGNGGFQGTAVVKQDGAWQVNEVANSAACAVQLRSLYEAYGRYARRLTDLVNAGRGRDVAAKQALDDDLNKARSAAAALDRAESPECPSLSPPGDSPLASVDEMARWLGKRLGDDDVRGLIATLPGLPRVFEKGSRINIASNEIGVALSFEGAPARDAKLLQIDFATMEASAVRAYQGSLPGGLPANPRRREVEQQLGPPDTSGGGPRWCQYYSEYFARGLEFDYEGFNPLDPANRLRRVTIRPRRTPPWGASTRPAAPLAPPRLTLRAVQPHPTPGDATVETLPMMFPQPDGPTELAISRDVLLEERSVANLQPMVDSSTGRSRIKLSMTPEGSKHLEAATGKTMGGSMAIVLDGQILAAPTVEHAISGTLEIDYPPGVKDADDRGALLGHLHAAVNALPPTAPSANVQPATRPVR
jgi:hypothetical protein